MSRTTRVSRRSSTLQARGRPKGLRTVWLAAATIVLASLWAYWPALDATFVFDDRPGITENPSIRSWKAALSPPSASPLSGRPFANLTFAINYRLGHGPAGYHAVNIAIHVAAALALLAVFRETLLLLGYGARRAVWISLAVATIWAVHPLNTGSVVYAVQRVESLMGFFYLLTLYCAIRADRVSGRNWWRVAAVVLCALGMATKEVMFTAPLMVWVWFVVFRAAPWNPLIDRARLGLYAGLAATWALLFALLAGGTEATTALTSAVTLERGMGWTPGNYLLTQAGVIVHYLRLVVVPTPLVLDYYGWARADSIADIWPHVLVVACLLVGSVVGLVKRHPLGYAGAWFFVILAPTSSVVPIPTEIAAEHRMYLPAAGAIAAMTGLVALVWSRVVPDMLRRVELPLVAALLVAIGVGGARATRDRTRDYRTEEGIWLDTIRKRPDNARARINYGILLMAAARYQDAERQMESAERLYSDPETRAQIHLQWGAALCAQERCGEGIPHLERALVLHPDISDADVVLAQAFSDIKDYHRAVYHFRRAVTRYPDSPLVLARTAWLLATAPDPSLRDPLYAETLAARAVELTGGRDFIPLESLAAAYAAQGRGAEALTAAEAALRRAEAVNDQPAAALLRQRVLDYRTRF